ncbi:glycosyltransferase [Thalassotalea ganghwensis]
MSQPKVVAHIILQLDIGGLERVMLNCIGQMQQIDDAKHIIISLTNANHFSQDNLVTPVDIYCLNKKPGKDISLHFRLFRLLRKLKPDILHSYNLSTIEYHPIAWLAGVKGRVHAEHGRDINDPQGLNKKHNTLRKIASYFLHQYIAVSDELYQWLISTVKISPDKVKLITNGINTEQYLRPKSTSEMVRYINVARLSPIKDHKNLLAACQLLQDRVSEPTWRMTIIGDGPLRAELENMTRQLKLSERVTFMGARDDIAEQLAHADIFVLSSIAEGIPMTILEAMSTKTAVVSTAVGGIPQVITDGEQGMLVANQNAQALSEAMEFYLNHPEKIKVHGENARQRVLTSYNEQQMVQQYLACYQKLLNKDND